MKMKREALLKSKEYWIFQLQNKLFNMLENYKNEKNFNRTQLAKDLGFNKSYITQVLNGNFDHKISKLVELSLASGKVPILSFVDLEQYVETDFKNTPVKSSKISSRTIRNLKKPLKNENPSIKNSGKRKLKKSLKEPA